MWYRKATLTFAERSMFELLSKVIVNQAGDETDRNDDSHYGTAK